MKPELFSALTCVYSMHTVRSGSLDTFQKVRITNKSQCFECSCNNQFIKPGYS